MKWWVVALYHWTTGHTRMTLGQVTFQAADYVAACDRAKELAKVLQGGDSFPVTAGPVCARSEPIEHFTTEPCARSLG